MLFSLVMALVGLALGTALGTLGAHLPLEWRIAGASLLSLPAVIIGVCELSGKLLPTLQCNRETPQRWVHAGAVHWAIRNGLVLGIGATSRISFWLWYVIPISALAMGEPLLGAAIYGTYSTVRGAALWPIVLTSLHTSGDAPVGTWLLQRHQVARLLIALQLTAIGVAVSIAVGL